MRKARYEVRGTNLGYQLWDTATGDWVFQTWSRHRDRLDVLAVHWNELYVQFLSSQET